MEKSSLYRTKAFNARFKEKGGDILNGIKLQPETNKLLTEIVNSTGLSRTKIINHAIGLYAKLYDLELNDKILTMDETAYLLRSEVNAKHLLDSLEQVNHNQLNKLKND